MHEDRSHPYKWEWSGSLNNQIEHCKKRIEMFQTIIDGYKYKLQRLEDEFKRQQNENS